MRAGGYIIQSVSQAGLFCTNGMSLSKRDSPYANSGLVVTIPTDQFGGSDVLAGMRLQEIYERKAFEVGRGEYHCPTQRATDYLKQRISDSPPACSYPRGLIAADLAELLPPFVATAMRDGLPEFD